MPKAKVAFFTIGQTSASLQLELSLSFSSPLKGEQTLITSLLVLCSILLYQWGTLYVTEYPKRCLLKIDNITRYRRRSFRTPPVEFIRSHADQWLAILGKGSSPNSK